MRVSVYWPRCDAALSFKTMSRKALLFITLFYTLAVIVIVSPRHVQNPEHNTQQDDSKSGKPGEYLWYKTGSEQKVAKSVIMKSTQERVIKQQTSDSDGNEELNSGVIPVEEENDLSGSGEPSEAEYMSGSGSYPNSYMVSVDDTDGNSISKGPTGETPGEDLETSGENENDFSGNEMKEHQYCFPLWGGYRILEKQVQYMDCQIQRRSPLGGSKGIIPLKIYKN